MYIVFDTETTGTPKNYKAPMTDLDNWPRIIQFAWAKYDDNGNCLATSVNLIKPDGWEMPTDEFWVNNGFSQDKSIAEGIDIADVLRKFITQLQQPDILALIAHNIHFDYMITGAEMVRAGLTAGVKVPRIDTMLISTKFCDIPGPYGPKWPKLEELHNKLFGVGFEGAHDAMNDVHACAKCFFELKRRGIYQ
jgi:DNA polymerase III subunit epsilon